MNSFRLALALLVGVLLIPISPSHAQDSVPAFIPDECPFYMPDQNIECGYVEVPENRADPASQLISLAVAILYSETNTDQALVYLEGGPGGSPLADPSLWFESPLRQDYDIILFDQRGTGYSQPTLDCPEVDEMDDEVSAMEACFERLAGEGVDLTAYTSAESAADIEAIRQALGYDELNLYGISYGTRLALTMMRDYPASLRSVILDGVYPPNVDSRETEVIDNFRGIEALFDECAASPVCSGAFPTLEEDFYRLVNEWNQTPASITDPDTGEPFDYYGDDLVGEVIGALYAANLIPAIPAAIAAAAQGDYDTYLDLMSFGPITDTPAPISDFNSALSEAQIIMDDELSDAEYTQIEQYILADDIGGVEAFLRDFYTYGESERSLVAEAMIAYYNDPNIIEGNSDNDGDSNGMFYTVECYEEIPFNDLQTAYTDGEALVALEVYEAGIGLIEDQFTVCELLGQPPAPAIENEAVQSDIPTLILNGLFDPITPPSSGDVAAQSLSLSHNYTFPDSGHGSIDTRECPLAIAQQFLANPTGEPDASCIQNLQVEWYIP
jgi:pimeloyl-ACP methyl ester carboxylesterase